MKVGDIILRKIDHVKPEDSIDDAAQQIFSESADAIPVCHGKRVVGLLTRDELLKHLVKDGGKINPTTSLADIQNKAASLMSQPVSKFMIKPITVTADMSLVKTHNIMDKSNVDRLPVVDEDDRLIGVVTKIDAFRALVGQKNLFPENSDYQYFLSGTYFQTLDWEDKFKHEIPDLVALFKKRGVKTVLDVGCGTGNYPIELANQGFSVVAVDRSSAMIQEANKRKEQLRRKSLGNVSFWNKEVEDFLYDLDISFDAILFMTNAISHNPNNLRYLIKKCANSLSPNGVLVFQINNVVKDLNTKKKFINFKVTKPKDNTNQEYALVELLDNPVRNKTILKNFLILASQNNDWQWSGSRSIQMAYIDEERIRSILENEGLKVEVFGSNYDGEHWDHLLRKPFKPLESDWLNIVAYK